ncbi:MAG: NAD-dependent epimerase/dehydratase family protein [Planctomycetes bacterium]|nr:NAD-dependent epimerase/dehydratase family protein [Planctomycetota bacterium]
MNVTRRRFLGSSAALGALAALPRAQGFAPPKKDTTPRILILGGTGFLGPHVVAACRARGWKLTLFNRGKRNPKLFEDDPDVETLLGDRDGHLEALAEAVAAGRRWHGVVDTSGYVPRIVKDSATLLAPATEQYLFISTLSVYADSATEGQDESGPLATLEDQASEDVMANDGALKALCEQAAEACCPGKATNLRPGLIVGPGDPTDRYTYWPARLARGGEVLAPGSGEDPVQYIDVRDLAEFVVRCLADRVMGTFNTNGPAGRHVMRELVDACEGAAREQVRDRPATSVTWVPSEVLAAQQVSARQDMPVWIPYEGDSKGFHTMRSDKAIAKGLAFRSAAETAFSTLLWWNVQTAERRAKPKAGLTPEREASVLAAWKAQAGAATPVREG